MSFLSFWNLLFFFLISILSLSCRTESKSIESVLTSPPPPLIKQPPVPVLDDKESPLIKWLKKKLPQLKLGMSFDTVVDFLELEQRFNGLITSEGRRDDFKYFLEFKTHRLKLTFDYREKSEGIFISHELQKRDSL